MNRKDMANQLMYSQYTDMEYGNDTEAIDYQSLISVLADITNRLEALEIERWMVYNDIADIMKQAAEEFKR